MPSGVHCCLFRWFLGKCFLLEVHPYMTGFCTFWQVLMYQSQRVSLYAQQLLSTVECTTSLCLPGHQRICIKTIYLASLLLCVSKSEGFSAAEHCC